MQNGSPQVSRSSPTTLTAHRLAFLPAQCCTAAFIGLLFTRFWLLSVLYAAWWFVDREAPLRGGRRIHMVRNSAVWRHMRDFFPVTVSVLCALHSYSAGIALLRANPGTSAVQC